MSDERPWRAISLHIRSLVSLRAPARHDLPPNWLDDHAKRNNKVKNEHLLHNRLHKVKRRCTFSKQRGISRTSASGTMGNSISNRAPEERLSIECIAKYMSVSKQQLVDLRNRCYMSMDSKRKIDRRSFNTNVKRCRIRSRPDAEILDGLYTMWDLHGEDSILLPPFILSLAPLACAEEDLEDILRFSLNIFERETSGILTADRIVFILKRKCDGGECDASLVHTSSLKQIPNPSQI